MSILSLVTLAPLAAAAAAAPAPQITGLWEGTVGNAPVVVCLNGETTLGGRGSYYYRSQLTPIPLEQKSDGSPLWEERVGAETADWKIVSANNRELTAQWSRGKRSLPVRLKRVSYTDSSEWAEGPCGSAEYTRPRLFERQVKTKPAQFEGWQYRVIEWQPPRHFADNTATSFAFDPTEPGDPQIIAHLRNELPDGTLQNDFIECMIGNVSWNGTDGGVFEEHSPTFANRNFIGVSDAGSAYCGGAHPASWLTMTVYDRQSGEIIDPAKSWFTDQGFSENDYGSWEMAIRLRAKVMEYASADMEQECRDVVGDLEFWSVGLGTAGPIFVPTVPHVATPCREEVTVPWDAVAPFLSAEGMQARSRAGG